jgi:UDP-N-acetylglucosamine enolpyruvyl transferase
MGHAGARLDGLSVARQLNEGSGQMTDTAYEAPITHPEEMRAAFDLRVGKNIMLKGTGRLTPAGIVSAGLMTVAVLLAAAALVRAARR